MFKASGFGANVVGAMGGFDVLVIGPAVEHHVAIRGRFSGVGVVVDRIGIEDVGAIVDFGLAAQFEDGPVFFLLQGADGDVLLRSREDGADGSEDGCFGFSGAESNWLVTMDGASSR